MLRPVSLDEFEMSYHGIEVGYVRRQINECVSRVFVNPNNSTLVDYGCGGSWWKEAYWPKFRKVYAIETNLSALQDIRDNYTGGNADLIYTRNGLVDFPERVDYVLSSSVVGYIHPAQAEHHLRSCFDMLQPGGVLILSRVRAFGLMELIHSSRLETTSHFSFTYAYKQSDLSRLLTQVGFANLKYHEHGVWLPVSSRANQEMYRRAPQLMTAVLPKLLPLFRFQHMYTAERPQ